MQIGTRFRLYPTSAQEHILMQWIGCQMHIYNAKVREDQYFRCFARKSLQLAGQHAPIDQQYSHFKDDELTPWLSAVPSQVLRNGATKWKASYSRYFQKLGGRPVIQKKHGKRSVWLTKELFEFKPVTDKAPGEITYALHVGTKKHPLGVLEYTVHKTNKGFKVPDTIHLSIHAGHWHVSFSFDNGVVEPTAEETIAWLIEGKHDVIDMRASQADAPPDSKSRPKKQSYPMTILTRTDWGTIESVQLIARSPEQAELAQGFDYGNQFVAGIVKGHPANLAE